MKTLATICILIFMFSTCTCDDFNHLLVRDYLQWTNLRVVLFVTCERNDSTVVKKILGNLQNDGFWMNHWDLSNEINISNFNYERFFAQIGYQLCVVVNLKCDKTQDVLNEISRRKMFHFERNWLMFGRNVEQMVNVLSNENINVDAEIRAFLPAGENEYQMYDVYNPSHSRRGRSGLKVEKIGNWIQKKGLKIFETKTKFERRRDLGGVTFLSVLTIPALPLNKTFIEHINSDENPHLDSLNKCNYRIFQLLMDMFNFNMVIRRTKIWGALQPNGSWLGAIGLINRSEVDICVSGLRWENERYEAFDQTTNCFFAKLIFVFRHPKTVDAANVFLTPFDLVVWCLIVVVGIVIAVLFKTFFVVENVTQKSSKEKSKNESSYSNTFLMVFGILFQQGYSGKPSLMSSRILTTTILIFSLCIFQFYSSFIVGSLLTEAPKTIKTIKQLLNSKLTVGVDDVPYIIDNFKRVREESAVKLYNKVMKQTNPLISLYEGLDMVKKGSFAYHTDGSYAYIILKSLLTDSETCDLQEVTYIPKIQTGPALPKKSPLKEMVQIGIRKIHETGVLAYQWKIWIGYKPKCEHSNVDVVPIDIVHFSSALYVFCFGTQISIGILIGEFIVKYCLKPRVFIRKSNKINVSIFRRTQ